jgi:hypothetical protein
MIGFPGVLETTLYGLLAVAVAEELEVRYRSSTSISSAIVGFTNSDVFVGEVPGPLGKSIKPD